MPIVTHGLGGATGVGFGNDMAQIILAKKRQEQEQKRLDILQRRIEQELRLQEEQAGYEREDRKREEQTRGVASEAMGGIAGISEPSYAERELSKHPGSTSPRASRKKANEDDLRTKTEATRRLIQAVAKVDPDRAQQLFQVREKELRELHRTQTLGTIREDLSQGLVGERFNVPLATGQMDTSGSEMAKQFLTAAEDPEVDPLQLAEQVSGLSQLTSKRKLDESRKQMRAEKAMGEMQARSALESPETLDRRQMAIQAMLEGEMDPGEFDKWWPDAGVKDQMQRLEMENAQLRNEIMKRSMQPQPVPLERTRGTRPQKEIGEPGRTDPELSTQRRLTNMKAAREEARARLGDEAPAVHVNRLATQILRDARGSNGAAGPQKSPQDILEAEERAGKFKNDAEFEARARELGVELRPK